MFLSTFDVVMVAMIGVGPSSSHTMTPMTAASQLLADLQQETAAKCIPVRLAVSLHGPRAFTGKGMGRTARWFLG